MTNYRNKSARGILEYLLRRVNYLLAKVSKTVSVIETDPVFGQAPAYGITYSDFLFLQSRDYNQLYNLPDGLPQRVLVSNSEYFLVPTKTVVMLTLEEANIGVNLPLVSSNPGLIVFITNIGTSTSDIRCNPSDGNAVWEGGTDMSFTAVAPGTVMRIINDGIKYRVL